LREKPVTEHIVVPVPPIIDKVEFEAVQAMLKSRDPRVTPPRVVSGPVLLTGLATCATCGGAMTLRTGTSKSGTVHRYYACSTAMRQGKTGCRGRSVPMDRLDDLVVDHLARRLLTTERLSSLLASVAALRAERTAEVDGRAARLTREVVDAEEKLKRLYKMVEEGFAELDDILRDRLASLKLDHDGATAALERIRAQAVPAGTIPPDVVERFGRMVRETITTGDTPFRKAWLRSVNDRIEVGDDAIRIVGDKAPLEQVIAAGEATPVGVRSSVLKWRAGEDSNP
jgi:site-specific DNA recombinase